MSASTAGPCPARHAAASSPTSSAAAGFAHNTTAANAAPKTTNFIDSALQTAGLGRADGAELGPESGAKRSTPAHRTASARPAPPASLPNMRGTTAMTRNLMKAVLDTARVPDPPAFDQGLTHGCGESRDCSGPFP